MYLQWSKIDVGPPDFREANRLFFIFWEACKADTRCYGMCYLKNRRSGFSFMASGETVNLATLASATSTCNCLPNASGGCTKMETGYISDSLLSARGRPPQALGHLLVALAHQPAAHRLLRVGARGSGAARPVLAARPALPLPGALLLPPRPPPQLADRFLHRVAGGPRHPVFHCSSLKSG